MTIILDGLGQLDAAGLFKDVSHKATCRVRPHYRKSNAREIMGQRCSSFVSDMPKCLTPGCSNEARQKFCSQTCAQKYHNDRRDKAKKVPVVCLGCGKPFEGRPDQKCCSSTCRSRVQRGSKLVTQKVAIRTRKRVPKTGIKIDD